MLGMGGMPYDVGMKAERYSFKQFNRQFPTDAACLDYIFDQRFPDGGKCVCGKVDTFYRVESRRCYSCANCGHQVHPCEGTIFHKSRTSLRTWFHVMFLMTASKNGVSAKEIERQTGVTYKCAFRMGHQVRKLMNQDGAMLSGVVEADETYVGGKAANMHAAVRARKIRGTGANSGNKTVVMGVVERGGEVRAHVVPAVTRTMAMAHTTDMVAPGTIICTDEHSAYDLLGAAGYDHHKIAHGKGEYVRASVHTNSIEGFWSQLKRSVNGTFHQVSPQHLQAYVNEFAFRYNRRAKISKAPIFPKLVSRVGERRAVAA
jgi:transposase